VEEVVGGDSGIGVVGAEGFDGGGF
jgi:hypothetical protein